MLSGLLNHKRPGNPAVEPVKDPICGIKVDPEKSCHTELGGKTYHFCRPSCKARFKKTYFSSVNAAAVEVRKAPKKGSACCG